MRSRVISPCAMRASASRRAAGALQLFFRAAVLSYTAVAGTHTLSLCHIAAARRGMPAPRAILHLGSACTIRQIDSWHTQACYKLLIAVRSRGGRTWGWHVHCFTGMLAILILVGVRLRVAMYLVWAAGIESNVQCPAGLAGSSHVREPVVMYVFLFNSTIVRTNSTHAPLHSPSLSASEDTGERSAARAPLRSRLVSGSSRARRARGAACGDPDTYRSDRRGGGRAASHTEHDVYTMPRGRCFVRCAIR